MGASIVFISVDPIASRVIPTLLTSRGLRVEIVDLAKPGVTPRTDGEPSVVLLDCRIVADKLPEIDEAVPVIVLHHGELESVALALTRLNVAQKVDAKGQSFESLVRQILASVKSVLASKQAPQSQTQTQTQTPSPSQAQPKVQPRAQAETKSVAKSAAIQPIAGRVAVGRVVTPSPAGRLKWHELYRDQGLLAEEARSKAAQDVPKESDRPPPPRFERRLSRDEAVTRVAEYSQARPLKSTVSIALRIARDSTATVEDMARVVKQDQALAARVLQLANCSLHRRGSAVRTVEQAIVRMGVAALRETISSSTVLDQFEDPEGVMNVALLWEHGYAVGMLAADLARATRATPPDDAFMIGLLHDMGRAVMASELGQEYIDALLEARKHDLLPTTVEKQFFEINHADVADTLFANWEFDSAMTAPIANHHLSDRNLKHLAPAHVRQTKLLQAADTLAHAALLGDSGSDWIDSTSLDVGGSPISPGLVRSCLERANKTLDELRLLNASTNDATGPGYAAHIRSQLPKDATLGWVERNAEIDLMGVLAWTLGDHRRPDRQVDVLLATIQNSEDIEELERTIKHHDAPDRTVSLVLSVCGDELTEEVKERFSDRKTRVVPQVYRIPWVLASVNHVMDES